MRTRRSFLLLVLFPLYGYRYHTCKVYQLFPRNQTFELGSEPETDGQSLYKNSVVQYFILLS